MILLSQCERAVFGWWRPAPHAGIKQLNGLDGWICTIFRNEGAGLSSDLILAAEAYLANLNVTCGPDGLMTYVWTKKIRSTNPGCCFLKAGWTRTGWSADRKKRLLQKPFASA